MKTIVNDTFFDNIDINAIEFFNKHGWVVIKNGITGKLLDDGLESWQQHRINCANEMSISLDLYKKEISQWRDLWTHGGIFQEILDSETSVRAIAQKGMDWKGVRLLHDHIIAKPSGSTNKKSHGTRTLCFGLWIFLDVQHGLLLKMLWKMADV